MALDGITVAALAAEFNNNILGSRIYKIAQPENDELIITLKTADGQQRLHLSANASLPFAYLSNDNKTSPMTAPNFCMLLRKYIQNGRITLIKQPSLERIIEFDIQHLNEMGDMCKKTLVIELMGKHSNIIFLDEKRMILDSIKHISSMTSSVREVLPGKDYFIPNTTDKINPFSVSRDDFSKVLCSKPMAVSKAIYQSFTGFSPLASEELCFRAGIDSDVPASAMKSGIITHLYNNFIWLMEDITLGLFEPNIVYDKAVPLEYAAIGLTKYENMQKTSYDSISEVLCTYYAKKDVVTRIRQKSSDLRKVVQTSLERNIKKYDLQLKQLKDTEKKDKYKVYGELITAYGYNVLQGEKSFKADNYYTGETIEIPLDDTIPVIENAKKYFDKYSKLKRTEEALIKQTAETKADIDHLSSISQALDIAVLEDDLTQIKEELIESGYIKRKGGKGKKITANSKPLHYVSSDGFHMYVGKNNYQNDELTFKYANGGDWWFHSKTYAGSHVIVKTEGRELPDRVFEEAGSLAAFYSKGRDQGKVEIDYIERKHVKKPAGAKPGFVVYYTNYSLIAEPDISSLTQID